MFNENQFDQTEQKIVLYFFLYEKEFVRISMHARPMSGTASYHLSICEKKSRNEKLFTRSFDGRIIGTNKT